MESSVAALKRMDSLFCKLAYDLDAYLDLNDWSSDLEESNTPAQRLELSKQNYVSTHPSQKEVIKWDKAKPLRSKADLINAGAYKDPVAMATEIPGRDSMGNPWGNGWQLQAPASHWFAKHVDSAWSPDDVLRRKDVMDWFDKVPNARYQDVDFTDPNGSKKKLRLYYSEVPFSYKLPDGTVVPKLRLNYATNLHGRIYDIKGQIANAIELRHMAEGQLMPRKKFTEILNLVNNRGKWSKEQYAGSPTVTYSGEDEMTIADKLAKKMVDAGFARTPDEAFQYIQDNGKLKLNLVRYATANELTDNAVHNITPKIFSSIADKQSDQQVANYNNLANDVLSTVVLQQGQLAYLRAQEEYYKQKFPELYKQINEPYIRETMLAPENESFPGYGSALVAPKYILLATGAGLKPGHSMGSYARTTHSALRDVNRALGGYPTRIGKYVGGALMYQPLLGAFGVMGAVRGNGWEGLKPGNILETGGNMFNPVEVAGSIVEDPGTFYDHINQDDQIINDSSGYVDPTDPSVWYSPYVNNGKVADTLTRSRLAPALIGASWLPIFKAYGTGAKAIGSAITKATPAMRVGAKRHAIESGRIAEQMASKAAQPGIHPIARLRLAYNIGSKGFYNMAAKSPGASLYRLKTGLDGVSEMAFPWFHTNFGNTAADLTKEILTLSKKKNFVKDVALATALLKLISKLKALRMMFNALAFMPPAAQAHFILHKTDTSDSIAADRLINGMKAHPAGLSSRGTDIGSVRYNLDYPQPELKTQQGSGPDSIYDVASLPLDDLETHSNPIDYNPVEFPQWGVTEKGPVKKDIKKTDDDFDLMKSIKNHPLRWGLGGIAGLSLLALYLSGRKKRKRRRKLSAF